MSHIDLEEGPITEIKRIRSIDLPPNPNTRKTLADKVRNNALFGQMTVKQMENEFLKGPPEYREEKERLEMKGNDTREFPKNVEELLSSGGRKSTFTRRRAKYRKSRKSTFTRRRAKYRKSKKSTFKKSRGKYSKHNRK